MWKNWQLMHPNKPYQEQSDKLMSVSHYFKHVILYYRTLLHCFWYWNVYFLQLSVRMPLQIYNTPISITISNTSNCLNCFARVTNLLPSVSTTSTVMLFISSPMTHSKASWNHFHFALFLEFQLLQSLNKYNK